MCLCRKVSILRLNLLTFIYLVLLNIEVEYVELLDAQIMPMVDQMKVLMKKAMNLSNHRIWYCPVVKSTLKMCLMGLTLL